MKINKNTVKPHKISLINTVYVIEWDSSCEYMITRAVASLTDKDLQVKQFNPLNPYSSGRR